MEFALLGPLQMRCANVDLALGPPQRQVVLALLAIRLGRPVSLDELAYEIWGDEPPASAVAKVRGHAAAVKRMFATVQPDVPRVIRTGSGYILNIEDAWVDLQQFQRDVTQGNHAMAVGDHQAAIGRYNEALARWRGEMLDGLPRGPVLGGRCAAVEQERLAVTDRLAELHLRAGQAWQASSLLSQQVRAEPLREQSYALLMQARYQLEGAAAALELYQSIRSALVEQLGVEPGPELERIHRMVLNRVPELEPATGATTMSREDPAAPPAADGAQGGSAGESRTAPAQLPPDQASFTGRIDALRQLESLLGEDGDQSQPPTAVVAVIDGMAGVGKTALATHFARRVWDRYPDGQLYADLHGHSDRAPVPPAEVLARFLHALGLSGHFLPADEAALAANFRSLLAGRRMVVVLDNAASAEQVRPLLPGGPNLVLVTSRDQLGGLIARDGAHRVAVGPLSPRESYDLLASLLGGNRVKAEPDAGRVLAELCGHLPLALRVAAARLAAHPTWTISRLAARLRDHQRLDELATGDVELRSSLQLSVQSLPESLQTALRRLGLLGNVDFAAWAVAALCGRPDADALIEGLVSANLLQEQAADETGVPRYRLHDLVATFAAEMAEHDPPEERHSALRRHLDSLLGLSRVAGDGLWPEELIPPLEFPTSYQPNAELAAKVSANPQAWLAAEAHTVTSAIQRACMLGWCRDAALLADRLLQHLMRQIGLPEAERLCELVRDAAGYANEDLLRWRAECWRWLLVQRRGDYVQAAVGLQECADAFGRVTALAEQAYCLASVATNMLFTGNQPAGLRFASRATDIARDCGDPRVEVTATLALAGAVSEGGDFEQAKRLFDQALVLADRHDYPVGELIALNWLGVAAFEHCHIAEAEAAVRRAIRLVEATTFTRGLGVLRTRLAQITLAQGRIEEAVYMADEAVQLLNQLGDKYGWARATFTAGQARLARGNPNTALPLLQASLQVFEELGIADGRDSAKKAIDDALALRDTEVESRESTKRTSAGRALESRQHRTGTDE